MIPAPLVRIETYGRAVSRGSQQPSFVNLARGAARSLSIFALCRSGWEGSSVTREHTSSEDALLWKDDSPAFPSPLARFSFNIHQFLLSL